MSESQRHRDPGVAASCCRGLGAQVPPFSRPLPFCPPLWSLAALKRRRRRIERPLQSRRPRRRRKESTKPAARSELRGNPEGREGAVVEPLLPAGTAGARAGWAAGPFQGVSRGLERRGLRGRWDFLLNVPAASGESLSAPARGPKWEPWAGARGIDLRGRALGRRGVGPILGRPLVSLERVRRSENCELVEASVIWEP